MSTTAAAGRWGFLAAHATHPDGHMALALAAAQIDAQRAAAPLRGAPTLGLLYLSAPLQRQAAALLAEARQRWPGVQLAGCSARGIFASGVAYFDEPALSLWLTDLPSAHFRLFHGRLPLDWPAAEGLLVHADPTTPAVDEVLPELAERAAGGLFGGLVSGGLQSVHWAGAEALQGGLSGVAFDGALRRVTRVSQGAQPIGAVHTVTEAEGAVVLALDGEPALDVLLRTLDLTLEPPGPAIQVLRRTLAGLSEVGGPVCDRPGQLGPQTRVRHLIGLDPGRQAVVLAESAEAGMELVFCQRDAEAARRDLVRVAAEAREAIETDDEGNDSGWRLAAAHYVSCTGRGGSHFGHPSAEAQWLRHALGDVPLAGFHAAGELAGEQIYAYTGVLTLLATPG